jgi:hypothetical protein
MLRRVSIVALTLICLVRGACDVAASQPARLLVDSFDEDVQNQLGGYRNPFARTPSTATAMRVDTHFHGDGGRSVRIEANRADSGFCGYWIHLFDMRADKRVYCDARSYRWLSLWVKGARGGEDFVVKLADKKWIEREDAVALGRASGVLERGITTEWQEVMMPLPADGRLNLAQLGGLTLEFVDPGSHCVYIDDVTLKKNRASKASERPSLRPQLSRRGFQLLPRKMWIWSTASLLDDPRARDELLDFCRKQQIDELWLQLLYDFEPSAPRPKKAPASTPRTCVLRRAPELRELLRKARQQAVRVHALDGYPEYALRTRHLFPLAIVDAVIEFNRQGAADERFAGVHFDNEPYLLIGWHEPRTREQILREFLELNVECQRRIDAVSDMEFGVDIPFWWQDRDQTGRPIGEVVFRGKRLAASYHCLELLDRVGVMNYRDTADGADGLIAHGRDLLRYADQYGRARVSMGIETFRYEAVPVWFAVGPSRDIFLARLYGQTPEFAHLSRLDGLRLRTLDDGQNVHVGVELPRRALGPPEEELLTAMMRIGRQLYPDLPQSPAVTEQRRRCAERWIAENVEWSGYRNQDVPGPQAEQRYAGFVADHTMLSKITFADESPDYLDSQLRAADQYFQKFHSYDGIAIHHYDTYRALLEVGE